VEGWGDVKRDGEGRKEMGREGRMAVGGDQVEADSFLPSSLTSRLRKSVQSRDSEL